jgi:hypothetical protein
VDDPQFTYLTKLIKKKIKIKKLKKKKTLHEKGRDIKHIP